MISISNVNKNMKISLLVTLLTVLLVAVSAASVIAAGDHTSGPDVTQCPRSDAWCVGNLILDHGGNGQNQIITYCNCDYVPPQIANIFELRAYVENLTTGHIEFHALERFTNGNDACLARMATHQRCLIRLP